MIDANSEPSKSSPDRPQTSVDKSSIAAPNDSPPSILILPLELLSMIVVVIAEMEPPRTPVSSLERKNVRKESDPCMRTRLWDRIVEGGSLGWIRLTHVCNLWRKYICENMPLLWASHIGCFRSPHALDEMLRRAGESTRLAVHSVSGDDDMGENPSPWAEFQSIISIWSAAECTDFKFRIRSLAVIDLLSVADVERDLLSSLLDELPGIQVLEVHHLFIDESSFDDEDIFLKPGAPVIRTSTLRELRFTNCFIPWTAPGLTHFSLSLGHCSGLPNPILLDIITLIAPTIEALELDYCLPGGLSEQTRDAYALPRLRYLYLRDTDGCLNEFVRIIQHESLSLTKLDLTINPDTRHWRDTIGSSMKKALLLLRGDRPFNSMTAISADSEDNIFGSLHEHIRLEFSSARSDDFELAIAIENTHDIGDGYSFCLAQMQDALGSIFPTIWHELMLIDLNLPLWNHGDEAQRLLNRLTNIRELRIVNPVASSQTDSTTWDMSFLHPIFRTSRLDYLCVMQEAVWSSGMIGPYCSAVAERLRCAWLGPSADTAHRSSEERWPIAVLHLSLVNKEDINVTEEALADVFSDIAERVEIRSSWTHSTS
ncbi:hypothetical protein PENSPDRAFT_103341 [Peniophora sp. CONT]|nr:hypothetical protein PENSPDRAFT_103341 [Peniophora sp. CONT]